MGSIQKTVHYCSVSKGGQLLYAYNNGEDLEIENLAALCLERIPPFHKWYFQTMAKKIFGFLIEVDEHVYFAIVDEGLGNVEVLRFLEQLRDEFRKLSKKGSCWTMSNLNSLCLQEKSIPVILPYRNVNGQIEGCALTKVLLLGKPSRQEKKKKKDHVIAMRDNEVEEEQKSTEQVMVDSAVPPILSQKELSLVRTISRSQNFQRRWCRHVRIVLAIDAMVCLVLFVIWLVICEGTKCLH
ncbi:phytolongin Phyl1.1-like [Nicotiana tabacum]|uniref:Phytolongin Phyl1.1-like n=2 Tax=Nicotiana TaxID=4085 RepID=A0A1S4BY74_TOBAC|nr:PREDICTED: probable VAMP-like protein At1g33475 [Nicotiana sylvestris]XP_016493857.1 PREDICTED: phytolongin Phyl1.1-like [Nicotiana tabacum]